MMNWYDFYSQVGPSQLKGLLISILVIFLAQCGPELNEVQLSGSTLAQQNCSACHQYPEPELLDKSTWKNAVLPKMGYMLGFRSQYKEVAHHFEEGQLGTKLIDAAKTFPLKPTLSWQEWQKIYQFYLENAPDTLTIPSYPSIKEPLASFKVKIPDQRFSPPGSSLVKFLSSGKIMVGDIHKKVLLQYDQLLQPLKKASIGEGAVHLEETNDAIWVTVMGNFLASDQPNGYLIKYPKDVSIAPSRPIPNLIRPVHHVMGDLNNDELPDIVICEFGKWQGRLSWWSNNKDSYSQNIISNRPGAIRSYIQDFNDDGQNDVIALFGQGQEGIYLFLNIGNGQFEEQTLLTFHPSMGSSFFDLYDFNEDGHLDIIYTAGDNADYYPIRKPYHGIYIYTNDGKNQFKPSFFYPMPGAYKAIPNDFDQDGDIDLAAIAFFPDYHKNPEAGFLFLENTGAFDFTPTTFPNPTLGRWINMDMNDYDRDGDNDLILGSLAFEIPEPNLKFYQDEWLKSGIHFIVLENQLFQ